MITIQCTCGASYEVLNEQIAERARCQRCGRRAAPADSVPAVEPDRIPCAFHPDQPATHNCLSCGNPLCMDCVRANGYYCNDTCRAAVAAAEPNAVTDADRETAAASQRMEQTMSRAAGIIKKVALTGVVVVALVAGGFVVRKIIAPKGRITATLPVASTVVTFHFEPAPPGAVLVQCNDELSLINTGGLQKQWSIQLASIAEDLELAGIRGETIILNSMTELVALDRATGKVKWKQSDPQEAFYGAQIREGDIRAGGRIYSLADGRQTGTSSIDEDDDDKVVTGHRTLLAITKKGLASLDPETRAVKWSRDGLDVENAVVGPDGSVYVTATFGKDSPELEKFRVAKVSTASLGSGWPVGIALLKLAADTGATCWGVRNIGEHVICDGNRLFVFDSIHKTDLLSSQLIVSSYSIRELSPRDGADVWQLLKKGHLYYQAVLGGKIVAVTSDDPPTGRSNASCAYQLDLIETK